MYERISPMAVSIGRQANLRELQGNMAKLTAEMSSGRKSDPAREMGVGASLLYKLYGDIQSGEAIQNATTLAGKRLDAAQTALTSIGTLMDEMSPEILKTDQLRDNGYTIIAANAREVLGSLTDLLNTHWDGQNLFGGTDSARPPLAASDGALARMQSLLGTAVAGSATGALDAAEATALAAEVDTVFNDSPADPDFYGLVYQSDSRTGDGTPSRIRIGAGETLTYDIRADNQAFKDAYQSLSLLSMLDAPESEMSEAARTALLDQAGELMRGARSQLTVMAGTLGIKQARLDSVAEIQNRAVTAATAQINDLEGVDYYTVSDRISTLEIQLKATYSITASLAELSFVNYL
jgi:flagellin-like hook-associated protein FlgL